MLGQPASSHTVTKSRLCSIDRSCRNSGPVRRATRIHSGLRSVMSNPPPRPASSILLCKRTALPGNSPGPMPRLNGLRSSGRCRQATSARSTPPPPQRSAARAATTSTISRIVTRRPSAASEVTALSGMPQGTMRSNQSRSQSTFRAKPCMDRVRLRRTPMAAILRGLSLSGSTHTPG